LYTVNKILMVIFVSGMFVCFIAMVLLLASMFVKRLKLMRKYLAIFFVISMAVFFISSIGYTKTLSKEEINELQKYNRDIRNDQKKID